MLNPAKIKAVFAWLAGVGLAIVTALFYRQKAINADIKREAAEHARKLEQEANEAMLHGMGDEQRVRQELEDNPVADIDLD